MINSKTLFQQLLLQIDLPEPADEVKSILHLLFEKEFGLNQKDILAEKDIASFDQEKIETFVQRINRQEPIQYILQEAEFYGRKFLVNPAVLIPRPETELIIELAKAEKILPSSLLDIGTGSGCLAISLALEIPNSQVTALDISTEALTVAKENADRLGASIQFLQADVLNDPLPLKNLDLIVSNPPYVMEKERQQMSRNVLVYEPAIALFVPDANPLLFYCAIAKRGREMLRSKGVVLVEINERLGKETKQVFQEEGYLADEITDINGKDRVIRAVLQ